MDDDLMPSDGTFLGGVPREPIDQAVARKREHAHTLEAIGTLKEVIARLEERILFYESVDAMPDEVKLDPIKFMNMHNANQLTRDNLRSEKEYIESLIDSHKKR